MYFGDIKTRRDSWLYNLSNCLGTLLQNTIFFMLMATLCVLMIFTLVVAIEDIAKLKQMQSYRTDQQSLSKASGDQKKIAPCQCHWPPAWCRVLYNCEKVSQDIRRPTQSPEQTEQFMLHEVQLPTARPVHGESTTGVND